jgi:hypothetical protein
MPYDGLFLPYVDRGTGSWLNLGPINGGLAQVVCESLNAWWWWRVRAQ